MRRHVVSTIYNNFIYMYINLFIAKGLVRKNKKFIHRVLSHYNKKKWMVENISGDWKDKLENFSKRIQEEEKR